MPKRINPYLVKQHRTYLVGEAATVCGVHKNTIRAWIKGGLPVCDDRRPTLILGSVLKNYLIEKNAAGLQQCGQWELYCLRCRKPREPLGGMLDYELFTPNNGCLKALCPVCERTTNRFASTSALKRWQDKFEVSIQAAPEHIVESIHPPLNSDSD